MKNVLLLGGLALALGVPAYGIVQKERLLANGTTMLVELAPVDPRSLIQGDYMRLDYAMARRLRADQRWPGDGQLVVTLDDGGVARFVRRHGEGQPLRAGEHLLRYRTRRGMLRIGSDAFHFQEGHAERYERARYGELRVSATGESVLVGLRDSARAALGGAF